MKQKRLLFFGAHPDDCEILCGGTAIQWVRAGHVVKFVSVTNGDTGHFQLSRTETAARRRKEVEASKRIGGFEYEILNHDCGLECSLANRYELVRIIRSFCPDVVVSHRIWDYHPDHRATAQLVLDTAYIVMVPHYCEDTPIPAEKPVYAFSYDGFLEPQKHKTDAIVEFDSVLDWKLKLLDCHASQFYEWLPWADGFKDFDVSQLTPEEKKRWLLRWCECFRLPVNESRDKLREIYGEERGRKIVYAETFEQSCYARSVSRDEFQRLMLP